MGNLAQALSLFSPPKNHLPILTLILIFQTVQSSVTKRNFNLYINLLPQVMTLLSSLSTNDYMLVKGFFLRAKIR